MKRRSAGEASIRVLIHRLVDIVAAGPVVSFRASDEACGVTGDTIYGDAGLPHPGLRQ
jgi:enoyl-[acyl-carrier-protein] reductase (NADH)